MSRRTKQLFRKFISVAVSLCFLTESAAFGNIPSSITPSLVAPVGFPAEYGTLEQEKLFSPGEPLLIHIQEAHGNAAGARNTAKIIGHLVQSRNIKAVFVEGAFETLDAKHLEFFETPDLNLKLIERLLEMGEITGSELALLESRNQNAKKFKAIGIEEVPLYRENFRLFQEVMSLKGSSEIYLEKVRKSLDQKASRTLSKELLIIFRHYLNLEKQSAFSLALTGDLRRASRWNFRTLSAFIS